MHAHMHMCIHSNTYMHKIIKLSYLTICECKVVYTSKSSTWEAEGEKL